MDDLIKKFRRDHRETWCGLERELEERISENKARPYIKVDEHTAGDDVRNAYRVVASTQINRTRATKSKIDELKAVQAAILYDRHNGPDPGHTDKRSRRWTYPKLARELGLPIRKKRVPKAGRYQETEVSESAEAHVKLGREILKKSGPGF